MGHQARPAQPSVLPAAALLLLAPACPPARTLCLRRCTSSSATAASTRIASTTSPRTQRASGGGSSKQRRTCPTPIPTRSPTAGSASMPRSAKPDGSRMITCRSSPASGASRWRGFRRSASRRLRALPRRTRTRWSQIGSRTLEGLRHQARLQHGQQTTGDHRFELLAPEAGRGFGLLPPPDPGDVFFDMEGYPYFEPTGGLEYLFGAVTTDTAKPVFLAFRASTRSEERAAFEQFIDFVTARLRQFPSLHVYHYAHYEPTKLKHLAMQHATREAELDALLRRETFVDLFQVVRQSMRTSRGGYSIKDVRQFFMPEAGHGEVTGGGESIVAFERWLDTGDMAIFDGIERYNEEDCVSTWRLRDWLIDRRADAVEQFGAIAWRVVGELAKEPPSRRRSATRRNWRSPISRLRMPTGPSARPWLPWRTWSRFTAVRPAWLLGVPRAQDEVVRRAHPRHRSDCGHRAGRSAAPGKAGRSSTRADSSSRSASSRQTVRSRIRVSTPPVSPRVHRPGVRTTRAEAKPQAPRRAIAHNAHCWRAREPTRSVALVALARDVVFADSRSAMRRVICCSGGRLASRAVNPAA